MKINAINNTNFKGLFTNKTAENNGSWKMEYQPYSWETRQKWGYGYNERIPGMSGQTDINIKAKDIPDNEKIYYTSDQYLHWSSNPKGRESCKDILGTEFYMCDYGKNITRKTITEMPAMTLEDSLRVKIKKLGKFLEMKNEHRKKLESDLMAHKTKIDDENSKFRTASSNYSDSYWDRAKSKDSYKSDMYWAHYNAINEMDTTFNGMKEYFEFNDGIKSVVDLRQKLTEEADKLTKARESGNLIDISRRDIYDPNKALWDSIQTMIRTKTLETSKKLVALPHRSISMQEIVRALGNKIKGSNASAEIINFVDKLIASKI